MFQVLIQPSGLSYETDAQTTVLDAANRSGIDLPSSCRNGTCRTCLCQLRSGQVAYRIEWPGLSLEEKRDNYILPCVAYAVSDLVIEQGSARNIVPPGMGYF